VVFYIIPFISTIFLLDLGTVRQCGILYYSFYFYDFSNKKIVEIKGKIKGYHTVRTVPKSNRKIVEIKGII
jgi:hypothetical protein